MNGIFVCVKPIVHACKKKTMGVCEFLFCMCVL